MLWFGPLLIRARRASTKRRESALGHKRACTSRPAVAVRPFFGVPDVRIEAGRARRAELLAPLGAVYTGRVKSMAAIFQPSSGDNIFQPLDADQTARLTSVFGELLSRNPLGRNTILHNATIKLIRTRKYANVFAIILPINVTEKAKTELKSEYVIDGCGRLAAKVSAELNVGPFRAARDRDVFFAIYADTQPIGRPPNTLVAMFHAGPTINAIEEISSSFVEAHANDNIDIKFEGINSRANFSYCFVDGAELDANATANSPSPLIHDTEVSAVRTSEPLKSFVGMMTKTPPTATIPRISIVNGSVSIADAQNDSIAWHAQLSPEVLRQDLARLALNLSRRSDIANVSRYTSESLPQYAALIVEPSQLASAHLLLLDCKREIGSIAVESKDPALADLFSLCESLFDKHVVYARQFEEIMEYDRAAKSARLDNIDIAKADDLLKRLEAILLEQSALTAAVKNQVTSNATIVDAERSAQTSPNESAEPWYRRVSFLNAIIAALATITVGAVAKGLATGAIQAVGADLWKAFWVRAEPYLVQLVKLLKDLLF